MDYHSKYQKYKNNGGTKELQIVTTSFLLEDAIIDKNLGDVKSLVASGVDVNEEVTTLPLALASARGNLEIVNFLLDSGALVDKFANRGTIVQTPLYIAAMRGDIDIVQLLIDRGANVNFSMSNGKNKDVSSVLLTATTNKHPKIVRALINAGAFVNVKSQYGHRTPIHIAAENGDLEIVQALITGKADINLRDDIGSTPLHRAVSKGDLEVIRTLLDAGANPNIPNGFHHFPIYSAVINGITSTNTKNIIELLLNKGANPLPIMRQFSNVAGDYINHRIISKRMLTKENAEQWRSNQLDDSSKNKVSRYIQLLDTLDSRIFRALKENSITEEQAQELGFIERYKEVLEKSKLLELGIENLRIRAEKKEEERVKNTNNKKRKFGTFGLVDEIRNFLG